MLARFFRRLGVDPAPNWYVRCTGCGREATAESVGIVRIGARSRVKRVLGRCSQCGGLKWVELYRKTPEQAGATAADQAAPSSAAAESHGHSGDA
ncbi:MAG: hypothetical protein R3B68_04220 [Phycisphaerales bacterium]